MKKLLTVLIISFIAISCNKVQPYKYTEYTVKIEFSNESTVPEKIIFERYDLLTKTTYEIGSIYNPIINFTENLTSKIDICDALTVYIYPPRDNTNRYYVRGSISIYYKDILQCRMPFKARNSIGHKRIWKHTFELKDN